MEFDGTSVDALLDGAGLAPRFRTEAAHDAVIELSGASSAELHPYVMRNQPGESGVLDVVAT